MKSIRGKKILITGAGGFIGSHLTKLLLGKGADVTAFVRYTSHAGTGSLESMPARISKNLKLVYGDIRDPDICQEAVKGKEYIIHLAAQIAIAFSYTAPRDFLTVNAIGTANLLQAAKSVGVKRFVNVSTSEVYGSAQYIPIDEKHPQVAQSPYAASKIAADKLAQSFYYSFNFPVVTVRPFNCYGPGQSARAIIPTIILQALRGRTVNLGNIKPRRDFNYVADIAEGLTAACFKPGLNGLTLNLASGKDYSIEETSAIIGDILGRKLIIKIDPRRKRPIKSEVNRLIGNYSLAKNMIGYEPRHTLISGLKKTIRFFEKNIDRYRREDYQV